jgi:hypothetical protein
MSIKSKLKQWTKATTQIKKDVKEMDDMANNWKLDPVEADLLDLGIILRRLRARGVANQIIGDTMINALDHQSINQICSEMDSYLRSMPKF